MQKFVNNWMTLFALAEGSTSMSIDLPDGIYLITFTDALFNAVRWEIVRAEVVGGVATLVRGREGTDDQGWPEGSVAYVSVTAGFLEGVQERLDSQQALIASQQDQLIGQAGQIADLLSRVAALEGGEPAGALTNASGDVLTNATGQILTTGVAA
ncbi:hypothetical protein DFO61_3364 [Ectopseudomonas oleovorans]|uniref:Uncharacterized protein n=1 Tax=Ectopseudomonas oleovorans TaxID=301 RepID=A0A397MM76_ECTOL|nr:hypothetical protein [Pseudomonas oleovorans]RIA22674.1 hypothetical protein DFO61_3364 [Pseudomonas oleovorans]